MAHIAHQAGDKIPSINVQEGSVDTLINIAEATKQGRHVLFAVPGAFTPVCTNNSLASFVDKADELKAKGVDTVFCIAQNDVFVMKAWAKSRGESV